MTRRPSIVHSRRQAVQPQTHSSPGVTLRAARRANTRERIGSGRSSRLTNAAVTSTAPTTTTMTIVTK
jgi:hypothetical protein